MEQKDFINPCGNLVKNKDGYLTFIPNSLPPTINYDESLASLVAEASLQLGALSGIGKLMPDPNLLIRPYLKREAVLSSKIEGTQASILDVFRFEARGMEKEDEEDTKRVTEVVNYVYALDACLRRIKSNVPIDVSMIKSAHKILMLNVRGQEKHPGEFRTVQNWIGIEGTKIEDARYVPSLPEHVNQLMADLEKFIQNPPGRIPVLVQCAMLHYQFEAIHPFSDGNGRIGRLLIPVLLADRGLLDQPLLYLSAYIERNKVKYYDLLLDVSQKSEWVEWIRFFLHGVISQATDTVKNIQALMALKADYEKKLIDKKASGSATRLIDNLFTNPITTIPHAMAYLHVTYPPAKNAVECLVDMGILTELSPERKHGRMFMAHDIVKILT